MVQADSIVVQLLSFAKEHQAGGGRVAHDFFDLELNLGSSDIFRKESWKWKTPTIFFSGSSFFLRLDLRLET